MEQNEMENQGLRDYVEAREHELSEENMYMYSPTPFYMEYSTSGMHKEDVEDDKDSRFIKGLYPPAAQEIINFVEEECDKLEYEGSRMFDESPDRHMLQEMQQRIYEKVKYMDQGESEAVYAMSHYDRWRKPHGEGWLGDLIGVILFDEIYRRRCRYRRCHRRFY